MINIAGNNVFVIYVHSIYPAGKEKPTSRVEFMVNLHERLTYASQIYKLTGLNLSVDLKKIY